MLDVSTSTLEALEFPALLRLLAELTVTDVGAAEALAGLVEEPTPGNIIPWSLDPKVVPAVAHAVARAWLRETRWDVPSSGPVPILGRPGAPAALRSLFALRLRRVVHHPVSRTRGRRALLRDGA